MNILHVKYAVEVARLGSLNKAAESLYVALPNISRSIKELEADIGISIFERGAKGVTVTPDGEEFLSYARGILSRIDEVERIYKGGGAKKRRFSVSVPRACYVSEAFAEFSKKLGDGAVEIFYKETNSKRTVSNLVNHDYDLGVIRYAEEYDGHFKSMLDERGFEYELVAEFSYRLIAGRQSPLAKKENITLADLAGFTEIAHADPYVPSLPVEKLMQKELSDNIDRRIFVFERASQLALLSENPETFMWASPVPDGILERYGLVQKSCAENGRVYRDVLIYRKGYKLTELDRLFITELCEAKRRYLDRPV